MRTALVLALLLTLIAAIPRFYELGSLGFYGDEETTALPSRALARGEGPSMPSGMSYYRALPLTALNAVSATLFGLDNEISYRIPSAILGTLTVPLFFLLARAFLGVQAAFVAAILLAVADWHISASREARMYAPLLLFYMAGGLAAWRWAITGAMRYLIAAGLMFVGAVTFHQIGVFSALLPVIPLAFAGWSVVRPARLVTVSVVVGAAALAYGMIFVHSGFRDFVPDREQGVAARLAAQSPALDANDAAAARPAVPGLPKPLGASPHWVWILALGGAAMGAWIARSASPTETQPAYRLRQFASYGIAAFGGGLLGAGQLYGAALAGLIFLLLHPGEKATLLRRAWPAILALGIAATAWLIVDVGQLGLKGGIRATMLYPFPYPKFFAEMALGVLLVFAGACVYFALRAGTTEDRPVRACLLAVLVTVLAVGLVSPHGGALRFVYPVLPFVLLVVSSVLVSVARSLPVLRTGQWRPLLAALAIVVSGVLGGHGVLPAYQIATLDYGEPYRKLVLGYNFYPDHKTPGEYVRSRLQPSDIVIAEDVVEQGWYVGRVDYWLRDAVSHRQFLYADRGGSLRDIYLSSTILATPDDLERVIRQAPGAVWLITSGETYAKREQYVGPAFGRLLDGLEARPADYTGLDGVTRVYCLAGC